MVYKQHRCSFSVVSFFLFLSSFTDEFVYGLTKAKIYPPSFKTTASRWNKICKERGYDGLAMIKNKNELIEFR